MSAISTRRVLGGALALAGLLGAGLGPRAQEPRGRQHHRLQHRDDRVPRHRRPGGAENWGNQGASARNINGDESAVGSAQVGRFVGMLPSSSYQLGDLENRLRASGAYVPVAHFAWSQTASSWGTRAGFSLQKLGVEVEGLSGTVFLEHGQFLHLGMMLNYAMAAPPAALNAPPGTTFTINETRRGALLRPQLL